MKRVALSTAVLFSGCYHLMGEEVRQGIAATDESLRMGEIQVAQAYITPTREIAGEPKTVPPLSLGAAELWGAQVKAKAARLHASLGAFLSRFALQATLGGSGIMALLAGWAVKNKRTVGKMARYVVQQGKERMDGADDKHVVRDALKQAQNKAGIRKLVQKELKNGGVT